MALRSGPFMRDLVKPPTWLAVPGGSAGAIRPGTSEGPGLPRKRRLQRPLLLRRGLLERLGLL